MNAPILLRNKRNNRFGSGESEYIIHWISASFRHMFIVFDVLKIYTY